ncbi:glutaredoxin family protein [Microbulbifer echini]|uniref:Glutaredoxin family protein n=1 Tax=Microbulbifer echini TaxID=1529067 RepID=A0ABV4NRF3_9GAMM|nr:glutaredoxin family protein [uncultured Microbulbifer sp.]
MTQPRELILYTTLGCSLCEKAKLEIWPLLTQFGLQLREVDIADNEALFERFSLSIPVVGLGDPTEVCTWPFKKEQLEEWLSKRLI